MQYEFKRFAAEKMANSSAADEVVVGLVGQECRTKVQQGYIPSDLCFPFSSMTNSAQELNRVC